MRRLFCLLIIIFCLSLTANLIFAENLPKYIQPTDEFVSKYIAWNKPSFHGPLKVLFIAPRFGAREIVEVCQRFDIQREVFLMEKYDAFAFTSNHAGAWPYIDKKSGAELLRNLLSKEYDVIVIGNIKWRALPDWARTAIIAKVRKGAGLLIRPRDEMPVEISADLEEDNSEGLSVLSGYPFSGLPVFNRSETREAFLNEYFTFGQMGQGRVIIMENIPFDPRYCNETLQILTPECQDQFPDIYWIHYDYYQALLGHLFDWLAKKEPTVRVRGPDEVLNGRTPRKTLQAIGFNIISTIGGEFDLEFILRDSCYGNVVASSTSNAVLLKKDESVLPFPVPKVPAGNYFADLWIKKGGKVVNYGSIYLNVVSDNFIEKIGLTQPCFGKDEATTGSVWLKDCPGAENVLVQQVDNYGRVVAEQVLPASGDKVDFIIKPGGVPLSVIQTIEARLMQDQETVDLKRQRFTYSELPLSEDVVTLLCQTFVAPSYLYLPMAEQCRKSGFNSWLTWPGSETKLALAGSALLENIRVMPMVYREGQGQVQVPVLAYPRASLGSSRNQSWLARNPCLTDPVYTNEAQVFYSSAGKFWRSFSPIFYNLGDESKFAPHGSDDDLCFSDTCIDSFQLFLQEEYGTIQELNSEYGTDYHSFDQVLPVALEEAKTNPELIPIWIDHRRHMDSIWANYFDSARKNITSESPGVRVGYDGSGDTGHGPRNGALTATDYWKLGHAMDMNYPYYWPFQMDCIRDLSEPGTMIGVGWFGGYTGMWRAGREPVTHRWWLWNGLFRGANGIQIYCGFPEGGFGSVVAPDFSFEDYFKGTIKDLKIVNKGIGKLLTLSRRETDNTAVLYSPASMLLSSVSKGMPNFWDSADSTPIVMLEALRQYRMVASPEIESNVLSNGEYRVLYLPCALALSDKEVSEILNFARGGGLVIADMRPAVADQHGKPREKGALDELFGVQQNTTNAAMVTSGVYIDASVNIGVNVNIGVKDLPPLRVDSSIQITTGKNFGKTVSSPTRMKGQNGKGATARNISVRKKVQDGGGDPLPRAGSVPVIIVNNYGKGKGVLLNMLLVDYLRSPQWSISRFTTVETAKKTGLLFQGLFSLIPAEPKTRAVEFVPGVRIHRLQAGTTRLIGLLWDAQPFMPGAAVLEPEQGGGIEMGKIHSQKKLIRLKLPENFHLYDVFAGKYEGFVSSVQREASPGNVYFFAALPYKPSGLEIKAEIVKTEIGQDVQIIATLQGAQKSGMHVFNLMFFGPDGRELEYYGRNIQADDGKAEYSFTLALNEQPGEWKVKATDVVTGLSSAASFEVVK